MERPEFEPPHADFKAAQLMGKHEEKIASWRKIVTMGDLAEAIGAVASVEEATELRRVIIDEKGWHSEHFPFVIARISEDSFVHNPEIRKALLGEPI